MSRTNRKEELGPAKQPQFPCDMCLKVMTSQRGLDEHKLTHMAVRIQCADCGKDYSNHANLSRHRSEKHAKVFVNKNVGTLYSFDGTRFHCGECSSIYSHQEEDAYWNHIEKHYK